MIFFSARLAALVKEAEAGGLPIETQGSRTETRGVA